jgi:hypothetical protein
MLRNFRASDTTKAVYLFFRGLFICSLEYCVTGSLNGGIMVQSYSQVRDTQHHHLRDVSAKKAPAKLSADLKKSLQEGQAQYLRTTQALLARNPDAAALYKHLVFLRKSRDSYHVQCNKIRNNSEKKDSILAVMRSIDDAIANVSRHIVKQFANIGINGGAAYAYGPREGVHYDIHTPGRDHFQLALPLVHGRLVRQMGDLMCKPSREFWGLRVTDDPHRITCWACLKLMLKILEARLEGAGT